MFLQGVGTGNSMLSAGHVVTTSVGMCDIDIRPVSFKKNLRFGVWLPFKMQFYVNACQAQKFSVKRAKLIRIELYI